MFLVAGALSRVQAGPSHDSTAEQSEASQPPLVVLLVVDQMRADYVDRFRSDWTGGLARLLTDGAHFTNAAYPYLGTYTCAGHATISTGAFPEVHGVFQNTWFDRARARIIPCTDDDLGKAVTYSGTGTDRDGPGRLRLQTFSDAMRTRRSATVVSLSLKARSAIMLAGHGGTAIWMTEAGDGWQTSTRYAMQVNPVVKAYIDGHPFRADYGAVWDRLLPPARYGEPDAEDTEDPPDGWTNTFPHRLVGKTNGPDERFFDLWQHSPFADAYLARMAAGLTEQMRLGRRGATDVLAVSFSSPDLIGHQFGPLSQEIRDTYARLDRALGELLDRLDTSVGRGRYVVALTADHGVQEIPEQLTRRGSSGGRLTGAKIAELIERTIVGVLGRGAYVARVNTNDVYFRPGVYDRLRRHPSALEAVTKTLTQVEGIDRVLRSESVRGQTTSQDAVVRAAALGYAPGRSGDLIIITKPGWMFTAGGTTHGSAHPDDQRVPIIFSGPDFKPGTYADVATPADIAPTLAYLAGIELPSAQGRALGIALKSRVTTGK